MISATGLSGFATLRTRPCQPSAIRHEQRRCTRCNGPVARLHEGELCYRCEDAEAPGLANATMIATPPVTSPRKPRMNPHTDHGIPADVPELEVPMVGVLAESWRGVIDTFLAGPHGIVRLTGDLKANSMRTGISTVARRHRMSGLVWATIRDGQCYLVRKEVTK